MKRIIDHQTRRFRLGAAVIALSAGLLENPATELPAHHIGIRIPPGSPVPWYTVQAPENAVVILQSTPDFRDWTELLRGHGTIPFVPDLSPGARSGRFVRALFQEKTGRDDWKNVLGLADPFRSPEPPSGKAEPRWVKFALMLDEPHRVIFQDSSKFMFHYDFARERIPALAGLTRAQFDSVTLHTNQQRAVLGAVLFSPAANILEAGIQFAGFDPYPRESVAAWFETVRAMLGLPAAAEVFYLPVFEQRAVAADHAGWFAERGIPVSSTDRWVFADQIYAPGWALGRLVFVPATEIASAYRSGRLTPRDILLTDAVPAEAPPLAGIISLTPATPNSHVALLAKSFGIPFVHSARPGFAEEAMAWAGREVVLRAVEAYAEQSVLVAPVASPLPDAMRAEIAQLKVPPRLNLPPKLPLGVFSVGTVTLQPSDIRFVGGKAAGFGILRRSIPDHSPAPAIALTFDLWDAYLSQPLRDGRTLRAAIAERLAPFAWPPEMAALQTALAGVRALITDQADFPPEQRAAVLEALQAAGFNPSRKIRFRSSTNVEDSDQFLGAGLYDSYSGCLADDLDGDDTGPSACDPAEPKERGVFRALRKVYASFYNDNAFLERLRHGVDEAGAGMAVLVHYSTPDEFELANGVGTMEIRHYAGGSWEMRARLVTQLGAISVANPDSSVRPEEVRVVEFASGSRPFFSVESRSSLVPLGDTVLRWELDYLDLYRLLRAAAQKWQQELGTNAFTILDFEYKMEQPGRLSVKQIRPLPLPAPAPRTEPWLISTTNRYAVVQGEFGDVISNHRLKSVWGLASRNLRWSGSELHSSVFAALEAELRYGTNIVRFSGPPAALPQHQFSTGSDFLEDAWAVTAGGDRLWFQWRIDDLSVTGRQSGPLAVLEDHRMRLSVTYPRPQPALDGDSFTLTATLTDQVWIAPVMPLNADRKRQERVLGHPRARITTVYYWPDEPRETGAGYTAPLLAWGGSAIEGLTASPIMLRGEFSQTYRPGHHNASEDFVFDPWLEPGLDPGQLAELEAANIRAVIVRHGRPITPLGARSSHLEEDIVWLWGLDGTFRKL